MLVLTLFYTFHCLQATIGKYIPPHLRAEVASGDAKRAEELSRLRKQLKGLMNRLAENNMHNISNQVNNYSYFKPVVLRVC